MYRARAVGGPRHNVVIEAPPTWNGLVGSDRTGRYVWRYDQWVWHELRRGEDPYALFTEPRAPARPGRKRTGWKDA